MTKRFAFAGRVSTEDQQDPVASRNWQFGRARGLIERHGEIVAEFFDIGHSRSIPWKRRPEAAKLLEVLKDPNRGFDAVVVGEPQRAFYGNQYGLTYPVFVHYGVELWVPEVGGPIDPESEAHDLIMSVFGGMSKGERSRIKIRVRSAMAAQAQVEGRFLGGRPPYGYQIIDLGPHPNPAKAADGKRLHGLAPDPNTAPVVARIFREYLGGYGIFSIAQRLTNEGVLCPSAYDRKRNSHRSGVAWSKGAVRAILVNPRYTGHEVWNKQRKQESLIDVEDVALGHETKMKWNDKEKWVFSDKQVHDALVSKADFELVGARLASRGPKSTGRAVARKVHGYALKGLVFHESCERRMQGTWNHDSPYYRCRFPNEYAIANQIEHGLSVYLREDEVTAPLDKWLAQVFDPVRVEHSLTAMVDTQPDAQRGAAPANAEIQRGLEECRKKLARHRAALEAGADPVLVAGWSREVQSEQTVLEGELAALVAKAGATERMRPAQIKELVGSLGGLLKVLTVAERDDKLDVYRKLGVKLTYNDKTRVVLVESQPEPPVGVLFVSEGGLEPPPPFGD